MEKENKILVKLNDIVLMNEVVGEIYARAYEKISNINIKAFLKEKSLERYNFVEMLQNEIKKLNSDVEKSIMSRRRYKLYTRSFSNLLKVENSSDLLNAIYKIELLFIEKYNELLREINLSLSLCKLLIKQRDSIQYGLRLINKEMTLIA